MFGIWNVGVCLGRIYTSQHSNPNYTVCVVLYTCIITYKLALLGLQCTYLKNKPAFAKVHKISHYIVL